MPTAWAILLAAIAAAAGGAIGALVARYRVRRASARAQIMKRRARESENMAYAGRLASGLIHEIRNPLSTLNLNLQLMAEDFQSPQTDAERRTARKIGVLRDEAKRLEDVLNKFRTFVGRMELSKQRLDVGALVEDVLAFYEPQAELHGITPRGDVARGLPQVEADGDLLKQALLNLILNAQAAMPDGGELILSVRPERQGVVIGVTDTGGGIPAEQLERIFDAYYSTRQGGTGMGLPIVRRIINEHGGSVSVNSDVGRGTQFTIHLPAAAPDGGAATPRGSI